jgi:putative polyhydroxyalkanoate system protein
MATVKFTHAHSVPLPDAKQRVEKMMDEASSQFKVNKHWDGDRLMISGSGFDGSMNVTATSVDVEVKLGLATSVFKGKIESGLKEGFEKAFKS